MTFAVLMTTFFVTFAVIQRLLPGLYRREFTNEYYRLMVDIERELTDALQNKLMEQIERELEISSVWPADIREIELWYETHCLITDEFAILEEGFADDGNYWSSWEEEIAFYEDHRCQQIRTEMEILHQDPALTLTWDGIQWFQLRVMRDRYHIYGSSPFPIAEEMFRDFAVTNNLKVYIWEIHPEIEPGNAPLGDILLEIDGRVTEADPMTRLGDEVVAVYQQNHYSPDLGGFAIAMTGSFQPAYRVLNIISTLQRQILIAIFFVSIAVSIIFSRYLARPIVQLSEESKKLRELEFDESLKIKRRDEIGNLSSNLNYMSYKLKNTLDDLQDVNDKLKREMEREREQERQRRNLFTSISHELKTPITILKGEVGGMIDQVGDYKDRDAYLESTYGWIETLEKLVSEILTISRLEGEKMRLDLRTTDISALLTDICHTHQPLADNQKITFNHQLEADLKIQADESQLQIAISNVINNAIFYTPAGKSVSVELKQEDKIVTLVVTNTGAHIAEEELKNLFNPFYRLDKSRNRHTGGSGLGLFIVKNILELHDFEYAIENVDDGVRFTVKMLLS